MKRYRWNLDPSSMDELEKCPRLFNLKINKKLVKQGELKTKAELGSAVHHGLALYDKGEVDEFEAATAAREYYAPTYEATALLMDEQTMRYKRIQPPEAAAEIVLAHIMKFGKADPYQLYEGWVEVGFTIPGPTIQTAYGIVEVILTGRIDRISYQDTRLLIHDYKTSGKPWDLLEFPNQQLEHYGICAEQVIGKKVNGAVLDIMRTYKDRQGQWPIDRRETSFERSWRLEDWHRDLEMRANEVALYESVGYWPKRSKACTLYGKCAMLDICTCEPGPAREAMERNLYDVNTWKPFAQAPELGIVQVAVE